MGVKSIENTDRLYWLGRYTERAYSTIKLFWQVFDELIEPDGYDYMSFCRKLDIPDIYSGKDDFIHEYAFGENNPDSIISSLNKAHDNGIELRDEIGSETLAYIQLAIYNMKRAEASDAPLLYMQYILDEILAFWGVIDDQIEDENTRNLIKVGKRVERIDLYARMGIGRDAQSGTGSDRENIRREIRRLSARINKCSINYRHDILANLQSLVEERRLDCREILKEIEMIMDV